MARVLFIAKELKMEPLGIMYLSAALKARGHTVGLVRYDVGTTHLYLPSVQKFKPDFIAFSVCSGLEEFYFGTEEALRYFDVYPKGAFIYGGPSVTFSPEKYKGRVHLRGEGEDEIVNLVEGRPVDHLKLVNVNAIPLADREIAYQFADLAANPIKNVITRRGCQYGCSYCFNARWNKLHRGQMPKGMIRYRKPWVVIRECQNILKKWPVEMFNFVDDNFASDIQWLRDFCHYYHHYVNKPFFCSVRPDDVTRETFDLLKYAGCTAVNMALESANDENRRRVLTRSSKKEAVLRTVALARKYGIASRLQNIIGLPVPDPMADALETLDFNIRCKPSSSWVALLQPYEGTKVYDIAERGGYINPEKTADSSFFIHSELLIKDKVLIERLHKIWHVVVRFPIFRKLVPLLIRLPFPFSWFVRFFKYTKKVLSERDFWTVLRDAK